jgi:hypothetical protein
MARCSSPPRDMVTDPPAPTGRPVWQRSIAWNSATRLDDSPALDARSSAEGKAVAVGSAHP